MNKETYEALLNVIELCKEAYPHDTPQEVKDLEAWADEVAKEYEEDYVCVNCSKSLTLTKEDGTEDLECTNPKCVIE